MYVCMYVEGLRVERKNGARLRRNPIIFDIFRLFERRCRGANPKREKRFFRRVRSEIFLLIVSRNIRRFRRAKLSFPFLILPPLLLLLQISHPRTFHPPLRSARPSFRFFFPFLCRCYSPHEKLSSSSWMFLFSIPVFSFIAFIRLQFISQTSVYCFGLFEMKYSFSPPFPCLAF